MAYASELKPLYNYDKAIDLALKEKKKILMYVYEDFCPWCVKMKQHTLRQNNIIDFINNRYVFLMQKRDSGNYPKKLFYPRFLPTTYVISPKEDEEIYALYGYKSTKNFLNELEEFK
jgi:thioredoxin-related protein